MGYDKITEYVLASPYDEICGHNGPYFDEETPSRALSHRLVMYLHRKKLGLPIAQYARINKEYRSLLEFQDKNNRAIFLCRKTEKKDQVNGTIGLAWILEGMVAYYQLFEERDVVNVVNEILASLEFCSKERLWFIPGTKVIDRTYNHQLWLAYSLVYVQQTMGISAIGLEEFLGEFDDKFYVRNSGRVRHSLPIVAVDLKQRLRFWLKDFIFSSCKRGNKYKEDGYQTFNVFAIARLRQLRPDLNIFDLPSVRSSVCYSLSNELVDSLLYESSFKDIYRVNNLDFPHNKYGFSYNLSAIEQLYIAKVFDKDWLGHNEIFLKKTLKDGMGLRKGSLDVTRLVSQDKNSTLLRSYELGYFLVT